MENNNIERSEGDVNISPMREEWMNSNLDEETKELLADDSKYFLHQSLSTPCLNVLESCEGSYIIDKQGKKYLDFHGNNVHQVGYKNKYVIDAIKKQLDTLSFCPRRYTNKTAIELAKKLTELAPGNLNKVLFTPGGTNANSLALKLARIVTRKFKTVSWWDSFHGASLDSISIGGESLFRKGIGPLLPGAIHVPPPNTYRSEIDSVNESLTSPEYIDYVMKHEGDVAAFIAEPIRYTTAMIPPKDYWIEVRKICDKHKALLIFDEIPVCLGRTGYMFAHEYFGVEPDVLCIGKGLGGGIFPIAAMLTRSDFDVAKDIALGHFTHEKSSVGSAAALATVNYIIENEIIKRANEIGDLMKSKLLALKHDHEIIGDVRGVGLLLGVELVKDRNTKEPAVEEAEKIMYKCLELGLSFKVSQGNILTLMPPLIITENELNSSLEILSRAMIAI